MKRLIDYVKAIEGAASPYKIVSNDSHSETTHDATGSTIEITKKVHHFEDGVSVEYKREYDDGGSSPGCKEFWYYYEVLNTNGFEFQGEKTKMFQNSSDIKRWLEDG